MRKRFMVLLVVSTLLLTAAWGWASGAPVLVTHSVSSYHPGSTLADIEFTVQVVNPGDATLSDLTLHLETLPPFRGSGALKVGTLAPHQSANLTLQLQARSQNGKDLLAQRPLHFTGKYLDSGGTQRLFPVTSHPGGAQ